MNHFAHKVESIRILRVDAIWEESGHFGNFELFGMHFRESKVVILSPLTVDLVRLWFFRAFQRE